jgi:GNAT superfamily N-acetyltransferase
MGVERTKMIHIRPLTKDDLDAVCAIAESLPEWFDEHARKKGIPVDALHQPGFLALNGDSAVGFTSYYVAEGRLTIGWLMVRKEYQRRGIGGMLLGELEEKARELQIPEIATYTLGDRVDYAPYEQTRAFYFKNGFRVYQRSQTDNPSCPEEIKISKKISG